VLAVPMVFRNGELFGQGRMTLEEIVARSTAGAAARDAQRLDELEPFEVLVVGGGPAASTAAIYAARKGIRTGLLAERFGGQLLDTMAIENYPRWSTPKVRGWPRPRAQVRSSASRS
jgi:alkyl hydroperoxide reductase subunit F